MTTRIAFAPQDPIHATIFRELGSGVRPVFTRKPSGLVWCELRLPTWRFKCAWVCSPGATKANALRHAISAARKQEVAG